MSEFTGPPGAGVFVTPPTPTPTPRELQQQTFGNDFQLVAFNGDFPNGTPATIVADAVNPGIIVAQYPTFFAPVAAYWSGYVPSWATRMRFQLVYRLPGPSVGNVGLSFYNRTVVANAAVGPWKQTNFADLTFVNTFPQYANRQPAAGITLADWNMDMLGTAEGTMFQFILQREVAPANLPAYTDDLNVFAVIQTYLE